jgi:site-specific recombinase XerD
MHLLELKRQFLEYLEIERGRSLKTIANYDHYLSRFLELSNLSQSEPNALTEELLRTFRLTLSRQKGAKVKGQAEGTLKKKTQNYYLIALRSFLKYMRKRNISALSPDAIELAKVGSRDLDLLTHEELLRLLETPDLSKLSGKRDKAILELLFSTGLRISELCSLNRDIDLSKDDFSIRGKGEKIRVVFFSDFAKEMVQLYLSSRDDMEKPLFISYSGKSSESKRLTPRSIERIIARYAIAAGISKKVTPHVIRHAFATSLLRSGADLRSVQLLLGHANISTTQIYTHITDSELEKVHKKFHTR